MRSHLRASNLWRNCRFKFKNRRQLFIRTGNVTLSVAAMSVDNPKGNRLRESLNLVLE